MNTTEIERDPVQEMRDRLLAAGITPERRKAKREAFRELQRQHPKMYAVIREKWDGDELVQPYVLAVAQEIDEMMALITRCLDLTLQDAHANGWLAGG